MNTKLTFATMCRGGECLGPPPTWFLVGDPGAVTLRDPRSVDSGSSCGVLGPSDLLISIPHLTTRLPRLRLMFGCGSLRLPPSAAG